MEYNYYNLFLLFFIYSFLGYIVESISVSLMEKKVVWNRGFLVGPYIPIFGTGAMTMILTLQKYKDDIVALFIMSMVVCLTIEYLCSLVAEKIFKLRWWNYSDKLFNINGRICLQNGILFGIGGVLIVKYVNTWIENLILLLPNSLMVTLSIILTIIFVSDTILSLHTVIKFNSSFKRYSADNTQEVKKKILEELQRNLLLNRLVKAFPNAKDKRDHYKQLRNEYFKRMKELRELKRKEKSKN
ncbi:MAG: putative ABC transporter permease [Tenericutes bacterium]|nr:putative ABC transporter permease [Mycoplasmatota bacterium]